MSSRKLTTLTVLTALLGLAELADSVALGLGRYPPDAGFAVAFGVFFLLSAWLLRTGRVTSGAVFSAVLCLFELIHFPSWPKSSVLEWTVQSTFAAVALAGLVTGIVVLAARLRRKAAV
jgi:hypothetical protein